MSFNSAVAAEIRAELARQQISGVRAAKSLGWTQNYISTRLRGVTPLSLDDLEAIAKLLEVPVSQFTEVATLKVRRPGSCPPLDVAA